jgi:hypothetical protein
MHLGGLNLERSQRAKKRHMNQTFGPNTENIHRVVSELGRCPWKHGGDIDGRITGLRNGPSLLELIDGLWLIPLSTA